MGNMLIFSQIKLNLKYELFKLLKIKDFVFCFIGHNQSISFLLASHRCTYCYNLADEVEEVTHTFRNFHFPKLHFKENCCASQESKLRQSGKEIFPHCGLGVKALESVFLGRPVTSGSLHGTV